MSLARKRSRCKTSLEMARKLARKREKRSPLSEPIIIATWGLTWAVVVQ